MLSTYQLYLVMIQTPKETSDKSGDYLLYKFVLLETAEIKAVASFTPPTHTSRIILAPTAAETANQTILNFTLTKLLFIAQISYILFIYYFY